MTGGQTCMRAGLRRMYPVMAAMWLALALAGCATTQGNLLPEVPAMHTVSEFSDDQAMPYMNDDPWERFNRRMYRFNYNFDRYIFLPAVKGYEFITPTLVQTGISNFFHNIYEFRTLYNSLFQLDGGKALTTLGRFVTNSTIGIGGLFNVADHLGLKRQYGDFDQTLGVWGVSGGPYLVLPILGPNTVRSAAGFGVDAGVRYALITIIDPFGNSENGTAISAAITALEAVNLRHEQKFRYYGSGYPFEYYLVRLFYRESREIMVKKKPPGGP